MSITTNLQIWSSVRIHRFKKVTTLKASVLFYLKGELSIVKGGTGSRRELNAGTECNVIKAEFTDQHPTTGGKTQYLDNYFLKCFAQNVGEGRCLQGSEVEDDNKP